MRKIFLIYYIFFLCVYLSSQNREISFDKVPINISYGAITSILESQKGFLYLGTYEGLYRYDGEKFKIYNKSSAGKSGLFNNLIMYLQEDQSGIIWISTNEGISLFNPKTESFHPLKFKMEDEVLANIFATSIYEVDEKKRNLWVGTNKGVFILNKKKKTEFKQVDQFLKDSIVTTVLEGKKKKIWIGTNNGIFIIKKTDSPIKNKEHFLADHKINTIYNDGKNPVLIGTDKGLFFFSKNRFVSLNKVFNFKNLNIRSIQSDNHETFWIGTLYSGIYIIKKIGDEYKKLNFNNKKYGSVVLRIFKTKSNIIFASTDMGLFKYDLNRIKYNRFILNNNNVPKIGSIHLLESSSNILAGSPYGGLYRLKDRKLSEYKLNFDQIPKDQLKITSIFSDNDGLLMFGTTKGLLIEKSREKNKFNYLFKDTIILTIYEDIEKTLWIGTGGLGVIRYDKKRDKSISYKFDKNNKKSLSNDIVTKIFEDSNRNIWIGTYNGLNLYNKKKDSFIRYKSEPNNSNTLISNQINTLYEDSRKQLWIGTPSGLNRYYKNVFDRYTKSNGLVYNYITNIIEDKNSHLWIFTSKGLSILNPHTKQLQNYNLGAFNLNTVNINKKGEIYVGGDGVYMFSGKYKMRKKESKIVLTKFSLYNKSIERETVKPSPLKFSISETESIKLNYSDKIFGIGFSIIDFSESGNSFYKYKMEGFINNWIDIGRKNEVSFTNLDPGEYTFRVKGKNSKGIWNKDGIALKILITPPFWKTWWFKGIIFIILIFVIFFIYKKRINKIKIKFENEYQLKKFYLKFNITERESEIIELLVRGKTNREIEDILYISYHTVRVHIKNIYKKLNINNKTDLIFTLGQQNSKFLKENK